eukprot:SAG22_NODE_2508_length_2497_cov_11.460384_2_plen_214_part_00
MDLGGNLGGVLAPTADALPSAAGGGLAAEAPLSPTLQNIVATTSIGVKLGASGLKDIARQSRNSEYNPRRFAAVIMRIRDPKTTALIFGSGKIVVTGAKTEDDCKLAARRFARIIQKCGFPQVQLLDFKIQNVVASCDVRFAIRLEGLHFEHSMFANYEPELFPGLVYKMVDPQVCLLVFVSGKVVLTGAKSRGDIKRAWQNILPVLMQYQKA